MGCGVSRRQPMKRLELRIPPPVLAVLGFGLIWLLSWLLPFFSFSLKYGEVIAFGLIGLGILSAFTGIFTFSNVATTTSPLKLELVSQLVTNGIYKYSRNPMYLGIFLGLLGSSFYFANFLSFVVPILFVIYITQFQIKPEERILKRKFGEKYDNYLSSTRRWL